MSENLYNVFYYMFMFGFLCYFSVKDLKEKRIPNRILIWFLIIGFIMKISSYWLLGSGAVSVQWVSGALWGFIPLTCLYLLSKGGIGFGDVKLFGVLGFWLNMPKIIFTILITFILGSFYAGILMILKKADKTFQIPLAPFILLSSIFTVIFNDMLLRLFVMG